MTYLRKLKFDLNNLFRSFKEFDFSELGAPYYLETFFSDLTQPLYDIKTGIKNLFIWFPIIYNDRNWDYEYINIILHKKMILMKKTFIENSILSKIEMDKTLKRINFILDCFDRLENDNYRLKLKTYIENRYGIISFQDKNNSLYIEMEYKFSKCHSEEDKIKARKKWGKYCRLKLADRQRDQKLIYKILSEHIESFWD